MSDVDRRPVREVLATAIVESALSDGEGRELVARDFETADVVLYRLRSVGWTVVPAAIVENALKLTQSMVDLWNTAEGRAPIDWAAEQDPGEVAAQDQEDASVRDWMRRQFREGGA